MSRDRLETNDETIKQQLKDKDKRIAEALFFANYFCGQLEARYSEHPMVKKFLERYYLLPTSDENNN